MKRDTTPSARHPGLAAMLLTMAALPTVLTLLAVLWLHRGADDRLRRELEQRAALVAGALAETSEYGLVSGNPAALDRSVRELLARDKAIASIDILDASRRSFVSLPGQPLAPGLPAVEWPVRSSVPDIDFFDRATPHVSMADDLQPTFRLGPVTGYVRVTMATEGLRQAQQQRLWTELGVVAGAGALGLLVVGGWARRLSASLLALLDALQSIRQGRYVFGEGPIVGRELRRLYGVAHELADSLAMARTPSPVDSAAPSWRQPEGVQGVASRLLGRLEAGLVAVRLTALHIARRAEPAPTEGPAPGSAQLAARILALADQSRVAGQALWEPLRSQMVESVGLDAALAELLQICARAQPACVFSLHREPHAVCGDLRLAVAIHRAVQGALVLVMTKALATQATVRVEGPVGERGWRVCISDNAPVGDSAAAASRRAEWGEACVQDGAVVDVQHLPSGVTTVTLQWPTGAVGGLVDGVGAAE
ncbi:hypothetical protein AACH06_27140 [Ideonella sp. DXS29W]|uniref:HAMP domain-containing protein n=1 Tax=Ideonella lacteola TaxID=2984193 RepID=A0ABU9BXB1_9BURK